MKKIVISAVNFNEGGPLSILKDCLNSFAKIYQKHEISLTVLVHKASLIEEFALSFDVIEYPLIKSSWRKRLYFEYFQCKKISAEIRPDLWISLHDMTPNVICKQVVYCHNPTPFYKLKMGDLLLDKTFFLHCLFYSFLYRINIKKNLFIIVQQQWIKKQFEKKYNVKAVVAYPFNDDISSAYKPSILPQIKKHRYIFFFPAFPRVPKNFETLLRAADELSKTSLGFEVWLTIDGSENTYAREIFNKFCKLTTVKFLGSKKRDEVFEMYQQADCLIFPSRLETWGLPISEFKMFNKPMLLAEFEYAHETVGDYKYVKFFNSEDYFELAKYMEQIIQGTLCFDGNKSEENISSNFRNWDELTAYLLNVV